MMPMSSLSPEPSFLPCPEKDMFLSFLGIEDKKNERTEDEEKGFSQNPLPNKILLLFFEVLFYGGFGNAFKIAMGCFYGTVSFCKDGN